MEEVDVFAYHDHLVAGGVAPDLQAGTPREVDAEHVPAVKPRSERNRAKAAGLLTSTYAPSPIQFDLRW